MEYLADLLTFTRLILAFVLFALAFTGGDLAAGFTVFVLGQLTDAFDGTCATKWPFPKDKTPKYRKYAAKSDMFIDILLSAAMFLFFTIRVTLVGGLVMGVTYILAALVIEFVVYGKFMGHPDDCRPHSLIRRNFSLAKRIILTRRMTYMALVAISATWTLYASTWPLVVKIIITIIATIIAIFLWSFQSQRRHHISRDAVDIEQELSRKERRHRRR